MALKPAVIERGRLVPRTKDNDLLWEAYLQVHDHAEKLGLLSVDPDLHGYLDQRLALFEEGQ